MNNLEKKMVQTLIDLRENHHVIGIKAEFEAEGTRMEEALRLKEVVTRAGLDLTIKIGGCEAIKDMYDARTIGVNAIVAPMIETPYALKKYIQATKFVFPEEEREDVAFLINTETITGYQNIDKMLAIPEAKDLTGIVLGRVDMTGSMGLSREDINSEEIFDIANNLAIKALEHNKNFIIGGGVSAHSLPFFKKLPQNALYKFETRKIIFDAQKALQDPNSDKGILKAVGFELMWLKNKREFYKMIFEEDCQRLTMLEARYKKLIEEAGGVYA
ncbi:MAG: aldolase/citrate lyase family protein [Candidatus Gastranaerophilales bacterium]|nr:aldolase/citrate lyase family protein [Candidatus Gastranaerophilales bacterium]